ncbi:MAG TPA: fluoride efflux transporter CrcB [Candidatus Omnitrophota bacterium]|nr:fluoride efflux transporter CrcB [Candidatus Omnitrophota bacterium]
MIKILFVLAGGGIGSLLRYGVSGVFSKTGSGFPLGTLLVNLTGSFLIGLFWGVSEKAVFGNPNWKIFIFAGVLGGFTTFSAYGLESFNLLRAGKPMLALANILLSNIFGIALVGLGFLVSRYLIKHIF